ncbi:FliG C-terminal domain-containing protein [Buchnera aphidicola]|uniref:FliG C-terminal domain-containing protein n=1 Tax=Buchnera aphidicola TaxID=9 RepID=UPI00094C4C70|nr:FliG C-terminal domain-containing protein [Buchnera aphidicola]
MNLNGIQRSALLLMSINIDEAAKTLEFFSDKEISQLIQAMISFDLTVYYDTSEIIKNFYQYLNQSKLSSFDITNNISQLVKKSLGDKKSSIVLQECLLKKSIQKKIIFLETLDVHEIFLLVKNEHKQIITVLLTYFSKSVSAKLLLLFDIIEQSNFLLDIENFIPLTTHGLLEFNQILAYLLKKYKNSLKTKKNTRRITEILKLFNKKNIKNILLQIKSVDITLANEINCILFTWNDMCNISNDDIKFIIQNIDLEILYKGLKAIDESITNRFYKNFSKKEHNYFYNKNLDNKIFSFLEISLAKRKVLNIIKGFIKTGKIFINKR